MFFAGTTRFAKHLRYYKIISKASTANKLEDLDIAHQMEAFLHALYDNNIGKWKKSVQILEQLNQGNRQYEQVKVAETKDRAKELNDEESKVDAFWSSTEEHEELKTPHTKTYAGQSLYGGWERDAIISYGELAQKVKSARSDEKGKAWEQDLLAKVRALLGLGEKAAQQKKKKVKKNAPPEPTDTPTKDGFNLAFE